MNFVTPIIVIIGLVFLIWLFMKLKEVRRRFFTFFIIFVILFFSLSAFYVFKGRGVDFGSIEGILMAFKVYFSWLRSFFYNLKTITVNVIKMDWSVNITSIK